MLNANINIYYNVQVHNLTTKLEQTKNKLDEECQINSALQKNQNEWLLKFSSLEKDFGSYKTIKDKVNMIMIFNLFFLKKTQVL